MKRKALLIEAGKAKGQNPLTGPERDVIRLKKWLESNIGGAWNEDEIIELHNPSPLQVRSAISNCGSSDFSFVSFSGHGCIEEDQYGRQAQKIVVGSGEDMIWDELKPSSLKNILICDACRVVEKIVVNMSESVKAAQKYERRAAEQYTRAQYRDAFDRAISNANPGTFFMYGCSPNQYSYEDPLNGGYFTISLIEAAANWWENQNNSSVLYVDSAFDRAKRLVASRKPTQVPFGGPENRSGNAFPFGICLK